MAIPRKDELLVPYSINFDARVAASPQTFNLTASQAAGYALVHQSYLSAVRTLDDARAAGVWSQAMTAQRNAARTALLGNARELYKRVQASHAVSDADKILLGVHIRKLKPSPRPAISALPGLTVAVSDGRTVKVRVGDVAGGTRPRRHEHASAAWVYAHVGTDYPADMRDWRFCGGVTRGLFDVNFPDAVPPGSQVWVCARWVDRRQRPGPVSLAATTRIGWGAVARAA